MEAREFVELVKQDPEKAHEAAIRVMEAVEAQPKKILRDLDREISMFVSCAFTKMPYEFKGGLCLGQSHVVIEGPPGTGKTVLLSSVAQAIQAKYGRKDGNAELMPGDFTGWERYDEHHKRYFTVFGPLFSNIFFSNEINRAPAFAYAPVLGAMEERQVMLPRTNLEAGVVDMVAYPLYPISDKEEDRGLHYFWFIADMNPLEKGGQGTYPLGAAHCDRFAVCFPLTLPCREEEMKIANYDSVDSVLGVKIEQVTDLRTVLEVSDFIFNHVTIAQDAMEHMQRIVENSRPKGTAPRGTRGHATAHLKEFVDQYVQCGLSVRADHAFRAVARTHAFRQGRNIITVEDIKAVAPMVMRHRLFLMPETRSEGSNFIDKVIQEILDGTETP